jgi:hypothetical protein
MPIKARAIGASFSLPPLPYSENAPFWPRWVGAPLGPNASIDRHGPWRRDEKRMADGVMTVDGWIRSGAVSGVECNG